jgi:hypothetical protein
VIDRQRSSGGRALRLTAAAIAVAAVAAVCLSGCSGDSIGEVLATAGHGDKDSYRDPYRDPFFLIKKVAGSADTADFESK